VAAALTGCGAGAQKSAIEAAVAGAGERATAFEATARALDEHPEYVDEFYAIARRHPPMWHRFLVDTSRDLSDPSLADPVADLLTRQPAALEELLLATLDAAKDRPDARAAIDRAVIERREILADILTDSHDAVVASMGAIVAAAQRRPAARAAFLESMRRSAPRISEMLKGDTETTKVLMGAMLREQHRPELEGLLKEFGLVK
jgi:hypothetical protein